MADEGMEAERVDTYVSAIDKPAMLEEPTEEELAGNLPEKNLGAETEAVERAIFNLLLNIADSLIMTGSGYAPHFDYCCFVFNQEIDPDRLPLATVDNLTTGASTTISTVRGLTQYDTVVLPFQGLLQPTCEYRVTISANCIYSTTGSVNAEDAILTFTVG